MEFDAIGLVLHQKLLSSFPIHQYSISAVESFAQQWPLVACYTESVTANEQSFGATSLYLRQLTLLKSSKSVPLDFPRTPGSHADTVGSSTSSCDSGLAGSSTTSLRRLGRLSRHFMRYFVIFWPLMVSRMSLISRDLLFFCPFPQQQLTNF